MLADARRVRLADGDIEYRWHGPERAAAPTLVFLHEGLGSAELWRDFPARIAAATGCGALVYSRYGHGGSAPCTLPRPLDYMHDEARRVLPTLLAALDVRQHFLVGHSDGASIALIHAGDAPAPGLLGVIAEAPHVFCEDVSVASIAAAKQAYEGGGLRERLARYHGANVDCAFYGWNGAWLDPRFRDWNIEGFLGTIRVPLLVVQGEDDEYGTRAQVDAIARQAGGPCEVLMLPQCGHAPHRDQSDATAAAMERFITARLGRA